MNNDKEYETMDCFITDDEGNAVALSEICKEIYEEENILRTLYPGQPEKEDL